MEGQNAENRERAQRVVALAMPFAAQVGTDLSRRRQELQKTGVGRADHPPDHAKGE